MKQFDIRRFASLLRWDFTIRRRTLTMVFGSMLVLDLLVSVYNFTVGRSMAAFAAETDVSSIDPAVGIVRMSLGVLGFFMLVAASRMFSPEQNRTGRIPLLMLPATTFEKFSARWVYAVVYTAVAGLLAFAVTDILVHLYCLARGWQVSWMTLTFLSDMAGLGVSDAGSGAFGLWQEIDSRLALLAFHGFFVLGAVLFRRSNFIITFGLFLAVSYGLVMGVTAIDSLHGFFSSYNRGTWAQELCYMTAVLSLLTAGYVLAYRLFRRLQLNNNKWLNV